MKKLIALASLALFLTFSAGAQQPTPTPESHEYAPIQERELDYKDWSFKSAATGEAVNLRAWARGRRLVLVVYFAPWCHNWKSEAPVVARLYRKFHDAGFDVVAVSEYAKAEEIKSYFDANPAPYPVVV